jgi:cardiolipin synthase
MLNFLTWLILVPVLLSAGCASTSPPVVPDAGESERVITDAAMTPRFFLASEAYQEGNILHIELDGDEADRYNKAELPDCPSATEPGSSTSLTVAEAVERYNRPSVVPLIEDSSRAWEEIPGNARHLPIAGPALWEEFRDRLSGSITPEEPGLGAVVVFYRTEELFFYYDAKGRLSSVPVHEKPADYRIARTYSFDKLLARAKPLLSEYIIASGGKNVSALIFNTGDTEAFGFPFVYADQKSGNLFFLQRGPSYAGKPDDFSLKTKTQVLMQGTTSQLGSTMLQPVGSLTRLFSLVAYEAVDVLTKKPLVLLQKKPVPPVADHAPMDLVQWEKDLDEMVNSPVTRGSMEYLVDGKVFFARFVDEIQTAEKSIDIRLYIFDDDDYALKIADLLKERSKQVRVRVLLDGLGTFGAASAYSPYTPRTHEPPGSMVDYLQKDSEIDVNVLLNPWMAGDHTKTIIIDNRIGFVGGMNIGREYRYDWHDLMVEVQGPVVDILRDEFQRAWLQQGLFGDLLYLSYSPGPVQNKPRVNDVPMRLLYTRPSDSQILRAQLAAIKHAQQRIIIENAYFTSDSILYELAKARRRGVDVRVIIPYVSDSGVIDRSNVTAINRMLKNGIRVYIYPRASHVKGAVYDGWICLGSANFDRLSLRVNRELDIATSDPRAVGAFLDQVINADLDQSVELSEPLPGRWSDYLKELIADQL